MIRVGARVSTTRVLLASENMFARVFRPAFLFALLLPASSLPGQDVVYLYDLSWTLKLDRRDPAALRRIWDTCHLVSALQGLANRKEPLLYLRYLEADDFWLRVLREEDSWLRDRKLIELKTLDELLSTFRSAYRGAVVWDEKVPATSNVASTVAGCENLLPLRHDPKGLFGDLVLRERSLPVKVWLLREDGKSLFTGSGMVPGTDLPSRRSGKADAYIWASENYLKRGKASPETFAYYIDGWWLRAPFAAGPEQHTLTNHDYFIARKAFFFDLLPWDDEVPVDDPEQPPGTDVAVLKEILHESYRRRRGRSMLHIGGFVPWAYKYTSHGGAGGRHPGVPTEWRYAEIISCFNGYMDADAIGIAAMANASFFQHYPLKSLYRQKPRPREEDLRKRGLLAEDGSVVPAPYAAFYVGDWDSAAWVYRRMPSLWQDPNRGRVPLGWAVNPNLEERFPLGLAWMRRSATGADHFIAGDSGAGYLNPGYLEEPRVHSGLPDGLEVWVRHCRRYYRRWDITLTGFIIDGYARGLSRRGFESYARFSPDGIVPQKCPLTGLYGDMPLLRASGDLSGSPEHSARLIAGRCRGRAPSFFLFRSILCSPTWHLRVVEEVKKIDPRIRFVDPHTLLALVRIHERRREDRIERARLRERGEITFQAGDGESLLQPISWEDGVFSTEALDGKPALAIDGSRAGRYIYFEVPDAFFYRRGPELELTVTYLDRGEGDLLLQYDSGEGAYRGARPVRLGGSGTWKTAGFVIPDARFENSQNGGADFRFSGPKSGLAISQVKIKKRSTDGRR